MRLRNAQSLPKQHCPKDRQKKSGGKSIETETYKFIILDIEHDELWPQVRFLGSFDNLGDVDS